MAILSWGKPSKFQTAESDNGKAGAEWKDIETPKDGTMQLVPTEGTTVDALEEGGGVVDSRSPKYTYVFQFTEFVKKGKGPAFKDDDGIVPGEHAFRFLPEDDSCEGRLIERATVKVEESYTTADGILRLHKCRCMRPAEGPTVKKIEKAAFEG